MPGDHSAFAHGDGAPQSVDTTGLDPLGEEWLTTNPYRGDETAITIGASGYNSNCARCHGLEVNSGGLAPDLRFLPTDAESDEWYINRVRKGVHQNGVTRMPKFEGLISQEAMWAIRSYIDEQPDK
ncbi:MAG: cytochrome c-550 PedF [Methyloceanibacter sp.]|nr:cytochrome c-550 PedF [Methyloceanibacter sp.]